MASSKRQQIIDAVATLLSDAANPNGQIVATKMRSIAVGTTEAAAYSVYKIHEQVTPIGSKFGTLKSRLLTLAIKLQVNGDDEALDPHEQWALAQVLKDRTLGGLAIDTQETDTEWEGVEGTDTNATSAIVTFTVEYRTLLADLTQ